MSATAGQADGVRSLADRFGFEPNMVVMEMGYDDDVDEDLRDALTERVGELVDEDTDEVVDAVLLWYRDGDGDLFELALQGYDWVMAQWNNETLRLPQLICLAQLNRAAEQRADKCPSMADLRDSGAIEQDADADHDVARADLLARQGVAPAP